jgi:hypothetical protein
MSSLHDEAVAGDEPAGGREMKRKSETGKPRRSSRRCPCCGRAPCACERTCLCQELKGEIPDGDASEDAGYEEDVAFSFLRHAEPAL